MFKEGLKYELCKISVNFFKIVERNLTEREEYYIIIIDENGFFGFRHYVKEKSICWKVFYCCSQVWACSLPE